MPGKKKKKQIGCISSRYINSKEMYQQLNVAKPSIIGGNVIGWSVKRLHEICV
jgi:hypothetical protein